MSPLPSLTVIIPTLNESDCIGATVSSIFSRSSSSSPAPQVLVVDGGSGDATAARARAAGARVLTVSGGRAAQLNAGAAAASAPTLLFLHADTLPPHAFDADIARVLAGGDGVDAVAGGERGGEEGGAVGQSDGRERRRWRWLGALWPRGRRGGKSGGGVVAGAFAMGVEGKGWKLRVVEKVVNWRSRVFGLPYGDQGLFLRRAVFDHVGGFPNMCFMEDYAMVRKLGKVGQVRISEKSVATSARRWEVLGVVKTSLVNQAVVFGYHVGVPVPTLANWYRGTLRAAIAKRGKT